MPDYLSFKRVYHDDLLHFGIKRRSGRYPWGSGERPYQSDAKRAIDRGVGNTKNINLAYKRLPKSQQIAIAVEGKERMFRDNYEKIKDLNSKMTDMASQFEEGTKSRPYLELSRAVKSKEFKEELDRNLKKTSNKDYQDAFYEAGLRILTDGRSKYAPQTSKLIKDIDSLQIEYLNNINQEVKKILGDTRGIGSQRIEKIRDEWVTYGDVIEELIKTQANKSWSDYVDGEIFRMEFDVLVNLYREEYANRSRK